MIGLSIVSIIIAYFYKTKEELDKMQKTEGAVAGSPDIENKGKDDADE